MKSRRRTLTGRVVSDRMQNTVVVVVERLGHHPLYGKTVRQRKRYKAHDENSACRPGDLVLLEETRPLSKEKRWRVAGILSRGIVARMEASGQGTEKVQEEDDSELHQAEGSR